MSFVENLLIRHAVEITALIGDHTESLLDLATSFLESEYGLTLPRDPIGKTMDREAAARLFFAVGKQNPSEIRNPQNCLRIVRDLWLDYYIATFEGTLNADCCVKAADEIMRKESALNLTTEKDRAHILTAAKKYATEGDSLSAYRGYLQKTLPYFRAAFYVLDEFFATTQLKPVCDLYNPCRTAPVAEAGDKGDAGKKDSRIKYLEKTVHDLKVKLEYAQKDAIRDIVMTLASNGYGAPLFELNAIRKDEATPDYIAAMISNLFLALESLDIRIVKDSSTGKAVPFSDLAEGKYCFYGDVPPCEEDSIIVKYPGIKLGKELIVKPTITKES